MPHLQTTGKAFFGSCISDIYYFLGAEIYVG